MTVSHFAIIRYVPKPLREEFLNIGVVVVCEELQFAECRFTADFKRSLGLTKAEASILKDFADEFPSQLGQQGDLFDRSRGPFDTQRLEFLAETWMHAIQFSEVRASIAANPVALLDRLFAQYVIRQAAEARRDQRKVEVLRRAQSSMQGVLALKFREQAPKVTRRTQIVGQIDFHRVDLAVRNGRPWLALDALLLHGGRSLDAREEISLTAWSAQDMAARYGPMQHGVALILGEGSRQLYDRAHAVLKPAGARLLEENEVLDWARETAYALPDEAAFMHARHSQDRAG